MHKITPLCSLAALLIAGPLTAAEAKPERRGPEAAATARITVDPPACTPIPSDRTVRLELKNAPAGDLVTKIAALTCTDFVLDPKVVTRPVFVVGEFSPAELKDVLQSALRATGAALVARAHGFEVISAADMTRSTIPTLGPSDAIPSDASIVTKIVRVPEGHDDDAICNYLNIFKSGRGQIHPYAGKYLVITDFADSVRRLTQIMTEITAGPKK